jgi:carotenoid cleavage dioxygenase
VTVIENPYLQGNYAPVPHEAEVFDLPVTGQLPRELTGRYLRIGPNPEGSFDRPDYHWFLGTGMVHGFRLRDGRAEWYRNRFVRGDDPRTSPNTNVLAHGGRLLALVEAGQPPVTMTADLARMATWDCDGALASGFTAHPKLDPATGHLHAVCYSPTAPELRYVVLDATGALAHRTTVAVDDAPMVHDMAVTATRAVVLDLPVTLALAALDAWATAKPMTYQQFPLRWNPEHPSRVGVLPLAGSGADVTWVDVPQCYVFHVLNAHDEPDGGIVMDVVRHDAVFRDDLRGPGETAPRLVRWRIDPTARTCSEQVLTEASVEFPRIRGALVGRPHRFGWFAGVGGPEGLTLAADVTRSTAQFEHGPLVKVDTVSGETTRHHYGTGRVTGEPAFVPRPGSTAEDDGWILSVIYDATQDRSELVVLDAADVTAAPVATVHLPRRVPFGFHGNWVADGDLD